MTCLHTGSVPDSEIHIFFFDSCVLFGGCLKLGSPYIWVNK
jgi:hypothetical protein